MPQIYMSLSSSGIILSDTFIFEPKIDSSNLNLFEPIISFFYFNMLFEFFLDLTL